MRRWAAGEVVVIQEVWHGRLWAARPVTVVDDKGDALALWCPKGTIRKVPVTPPTRPRPQSRPAWLADLLSSGDWLLVDSVWDVSTLWLLREGDWHAVWVSFLETGEHWGWYVNLQEPFRRTSRGITTMDMMLDILVDGDRSWRWKDEDDFETLVAHRLLDTEAAAAVRREAAKVVGRVERGDPPFDGSWRDWRPKEDWLTPQLPDSWDKL
jgi:predicted RNA-binding protein associated with RNAse of E/G family